MGVRRENTIYEFEDFRLDAAHLLLYRRDEQVSLTPKAIETLLALLERRGEVVGKDDLMRMIWADTVVEESNLAQYLHLLRKTLGKRSDGTQFIETLKRRGYRFNGPVAVSEGASAVSVPRREEPASANVSSTRPVAEHPPHRVERRGNVLALLEWQENKHEPVDEPAAVPLPDSQHVDSSFGLQFGLPWVLLAACAALLVTTLSLIWIKYPSNQKAAAAGSDLRILNLTNGEWLDFATISPNGNYFVYASHDGELVHLWLQQTGHATRTEILTPFAGAIYGTTFSPDSQFIYFVANEKPTEPNVLYRIPALGGVRTKILTDIATPVSISPDGEELVFMRVSQEPSGSSLIVASSDGTRDRVLLTRVRDEAISTGIAWSPDGRSIAFGALSIKPVGGQCTIAAVDPENGNTTELSPERWDTCYRMAWTRDGNGLVFSGTKFREAYSTRRDQIYYLSITDGVARRLTTDGNRHQYASLGVTDKDEILAVPFNRSSQIWSMDAGGDSGTAVQITTGQADGRGGIAPLADGRVSYLTRNGDGFSIWLMGADGTGRNQLTTDPPNIEELRAAPDGSFFVFAAPLDRLSHLYRVDADGTNLTQLTFGDSHEIDSSVSPDGKWVVYASMVFNSGYGKSALWKIASGGGEPVRLADIECTTPHFSPDGKFVSCVVEYLKKIIVISAEDGSVVKTFTSDKTSVLNTGSRWTPDGKALAYIAFHNNVGNIWLQPINGDAKYQMTDFTSGDIFNFAFGATDSRLYLARGHSIRNAILISNFK
jgi:Tol biopolymer transport system component/DNA-binding winged helix-turn-helix (wHTH) protein